MICATRVGVQIQPRDVVVSANLHTAEPREVAPAWLVQTLLSMNRSEWLTRLSSQPACAFVGIDGRQRADVIAYERQRGVATAVGASLYHADPAAASGAFQFPRPPRQADRLVDQLGRMNRVGFADREGQAVAGFGAEAGGAVLGAVGWERIMHHPAIPIGAESFRGSSHIRGAVATGGLCGRGARWPALLLFRPRMSCQPTF